LASPVRSQDWIVDLSNRFTEGMQDEFLKADENAST
jgi:hypothetical protein